MLPTAVKSDFVKAGDRLVEPSFCDGSLDDPVRTRRHRRCATRHPGPPSSVETSTSGFSIASRHTASIFDQLCASRGTYRVKHVVVAAELGRSLVRLARGYVGSLAEAVWSRSVIFVDRWGPAAKRGFVKTGGRLDELSCEGGLHDPIPWPPREARFAARLFIRRADSEATPPPPHCRHVRLSAGSLVAVRARADGKTQRADAVAALALIVAGRGVPQGALAQLQQRYF